MGIQKYRKLKQNRCVTFSNKYQLLPLSFMGKGFSMGSDGIEYI